jgi:hypothetical protein
LLGDIATHPDRLMPGAARATTRKSRRSPSRAACAPLVAHCHLGLGKLYRRTGKPNQAQEDLRSAMTMYREMDMRFWLEQAEAEMRELA